VNTGILKRLVVYAQINNFSNYYKMDRKILILGITLTVVILFLSFRKEGFSTAELESARTSEEEDIGEVEVPPGLNISDFLRKLEIMKEENKKNEETLDALYDVNSDTNQDSQEQASEAIQDENDAQYAFLKDFVDGAQQTEQEIRDDARTQVNAQLEAIVTNQAADYFATKDTGFDDVPKKKGIVKVDNIWFDSLNAGLATATDITTYGGTNVYGDGDQFRKAIVPRCHERPQLSGGDQVYDDFNGWSGQRNYDLSQPAWSCLNSDGVPGKVDEDGFVVDNFEQCATKCLVNDKCSGFSVVPDSTFPEEGFGLTCKLTHHEFEDSKEVPASKNEQVFAVHENDYLKNPLYNDLFTGRSGAGGLYARRFGSDNHAYSGKDHCHWRSSCYYRPPWGCALGKIFPDHIDDYRSYACENGVKIENDGIPRDCEGGWSARVKGGKSSDWHSIDNVQTLSQRVNEGPNGSPAVCPGGRYYPYGGEDETFELTFQKTPGGYDAINGGRCPATSDEPTTTIEVPCGAEEAPAPPPADKECKLEYTDEIGSFYKNDSGNYCVSDLKNASSGGMTVNRIWKVTQAPTGGEKCMYPSLKNVGDTITFPNASPTVANPGYPECPAHLFTDCVKKKSVGTCGSYSQGTCGTGKKIINYVVSQEPGRYGKSCDAYDRRNLPESNWNGGTTEETCEKPCNQGFCTARTLNQQSCPSECKQDDAGNCCVNVVSVEGEEGDATGVCVPSRYGDNQKYTGKNSLGWGTYSSASLDDWYRDSACRGIYFGDGRWDGLYMMNDGILGPSGKKPYTCHKSGGSPSYQDELKPFIDDMTFSWPVQNTHYLEDDAMKDMEDRSTLGWEGLLNNRGIDRAYGSEGQKSCHKTGDYGYAQWGYIDPIYCKYIDIKNYGQKSDRKKRQFWYDEMNKD